MSLKQQAVNGLLWSTIDSLAIQGIQLAVGIVLARLLSPREFGLIGMIVVFTAISQPFIDGGFNQALIRKRDCGQNEYSTVFYFNFGVATFCYLILFTFSGPIAHFFREPQLVLLIRVTGLNLIINGTGMVQKAILTKNIDFKLQTRISVISSIASGVIGVGAAVFGWGVWSLVWKTVSQNALSNGLLWLWSDWRPAFLFNIKSFREMAGFGTKLLLVALIDTIYKNIYYLIIGKFFSAVDLGYYTRADDFARLPSGNLGTVVGRVSYPTLSTMQNDRERLRAACKKLLPAVMFVSFMLMMGIAGVAKSMIVVLIGEKWLPCVPYLQLLCFVGMFYPLQALNLDVLNLSGRPDLTLRLEIVKKLLAVPAIIIGVLVGIKAMILGMIGISIVSYYLNSYWSGRTMNYPFKEQIADMVPSFMIASTAGIVALLVGLWLPVKPGVNLVIQIVSGAAVALFIARLFRVSAFMEIVVVLRGAFRPAFRKMLNLI